MTDRVVAIIQARMNSSRLPGKVLLDLGGKPMLERVFVRTSRASTLAQTLVATTTDSSDDPVMEFSKASRIPYTRGSQFDVLDRYYQAAKFSRADIVVRITADCPIIDPDLIDQVVNLVLGDQSSGHMEAFDFAANRLPPPWKRTYPIGLDTEVCTFEALERCWHDAKEPGQREHVMPFFYEGIHLTASKRGLSSGKSPSGFRVVLLDHDPDYGSFRWTVDTPEDLKFMRIVYSKFTGRDDFSWKEVLDLVLKEPELSEINAGVTHKTLKDIDTRGLARVSPNTM